MNSPKDYLTDTDILQKLTDNIICSVGAEPDGHKLKIKTTDELIEIIKPFLTETIQQSMEVGREEERNRITEIIEDYTTPSHPHIHSMRWLKLDSETLNEMMKVINSVNK